MSGSETDEHPLGPGDVEILDRETVYKGYARVERYRLRHRLFAGGWSQPLVREVFERGHAVAVLPYDPARDEVVLIAQFRIGAYAAGMPSPWLVELVAGVIEAGESPDAVARRELEEEAGLIALDLAPVTRVIMSPGVMTESVHLFCARVESAQAGGFHGVEAEGEDIRVFSVPAETAFAMVRDGRIDNSIAVMGLLWLAAERDGLRRRWPATDPA